MPGGFARDSADFHEICGLARKFHENGQGSLEALSTRGEGD
jgi:hypothetical protein